MKQFNRDINKAADMIDRLASSLQDDKNIKKHFYESGNEDIVIALDTNEYKEAAILIVAAYIFRNRIYI